MIIDKYLLFDKIFNARKFKLKKKTDDKITIDIISAFDIETTRLIDIEQSIMYIWQWNFLIGDNNYTIIGRTWSEFISFARELVDALNGYKLIVFVHNLSYEFQFLSGIYNFKVGDVFAVKSRKVLKCTMLDVLEFRCSYLLTNMSLDMFTTKMGVENKKLSGYDYDKIRYPWTPLTEEELQYCINDVVGLCQAIKIQNNINNDTLVTMPLTSTGYVRRDLKRAMYVCKKSISKIMPTYHIYEMEREAFVGGDTHANRFYVGMEIDGVECDDITSSYPAAVTCCKFPMSKFLNQGSCTEEYTREEIKHGKACLMRVHIEGIKLKDPYFGCPYIHRDKCRNTKNIIVDNGRILEADEIDITITDIDFSIIDDEYTWKTIKIYELATAKYGMLPKQCREVVIKYFIDKTKLKNVKGQEQYYDKSKNLLNAIYGMFAQNPVKQSIDYINDEFIERDDDESILLDNYCAKTVVAYQWGLWVTAHARRALHDMIHYVGTDNFIYCDTDSVYHTGTIDLEEYNEYLKNRAIENNAYADDLKGKRYYMGVFDLDKKCDIFKTWGAKRYMYTKGGEYHVVVSGVSKKKMKKAEKK